MDIVGLFYSNLTLYRPERPRVLAALRKLRRDAYVSPTFDGHTVIFDQITEDQDSDEIERLGIEISATLKCVALAAVLHDDDVLYLWLFDRGQALDHYDS